MTFVTVFRRVPKPILGKESIVSKGRCLSRAQLARAVGLRLGWERSAA
jgi:hypothetical protein